MGNPMARCLIEAGHHLTVHDLRREATSNLCDLGARWADTPRATAQASEVVFTSLPGPAEVERAMVDPSTGILAGLKAGGACIDMTTNAPSVVRRIADVCRARGAEFLDAPVSGRPPSMTIMVGGQATTFARYRPLLEAMGRNIFYVGDTDTGPAGISHCGASPGSHGGRGAAGGRVQIRRRLPGQGSPAGIAMTDHSDDIAHLLLQQKIESFLYREAELLDERRYEEWLALLAEDVRYWMPMRRNVKFGELEREFTREGQDVNWFDEGKETLTRRVQQILTGVHWAEEPLSRICHMVSNIQILDVNPSASAPSEVTVKSRFLIYRNRVETETDILVGKREDVLHRVEGQWKIRRRKIVLDQNVLQVKNLTFFF